MKPILYYDIMCGNIPIIYLIEAQDFYCMRICHCWSPRPLFDASFSTIGDEFVHDKI
jgi:hypothetical protein